MLGHSHHVILANKVICLLCLEVELCRCFVVTPLSFGALQEMLGLAKPSANQGRGPQAGQQQQPLSNR